jgi:hypothetical protein
LRAGIGSEDHLRIENSDQPVEVAVTCSCDKSVDNVSWSFDVGVRSGLARLNATSRAAGEFASRNRGALDDGCDLLEGRVKGPSAWPNLRSNFVSPD